MDWRSAHLPGEETDAQLKGLGCDTILEGKGQLGVLCRLEHDDELRSFGGGSWRKEGRAGREVFFNDFSLPNTWVHWLWSRNRKKARKGVVVSRRFRRPRLKTRRHPRKRQFLCGRGALQLRFFSRGLLGRKLLLLASLPHKDLAALQYVHRAEVEQRVLQNAARTEVDDEGGEVVCQSHEDINQFSLIRQLFQTES